MNEYYAILAAVSAIWLILCVVAYRRTRALSFQFGFVLLYFLTLYGAWAIIYDRTGGDSGMHYAYFENRLFPIYLDDSYFWTLALYGAFLIALQGTVCLAAHRTPADTRSSAERPVVALRHGRLLLLCACCGLLSLSIVADSLMTARSLGVGGYQYVKRGAGEAPVLFTIHQVLNKLSVVPAALGLAITCSGPAPRIIAGRGSRRLAAIGYSAAIAFGVALSFQLGYKSDIYAPAIAGMFFYLRNARRPKVFRLALVGALAVLGMGLIDVTRYGGPTQTDSLGKAFGAIVRSNEAFAPHISLYGILSHDVPPQFGMSFVSLGASLVPRVLWAGRPRDSYAYYASSVNAVPGQGYTVHHAAGWYLNFGAGGVVIGGALLGFIWARCHNASNNRTRYRPSGATGRWRCVLTATASSMFLGYMPFVTTAGPESFKSLFIEGMLLAGMMVAVCSITVGSNQFDGITIGEPLAPRCSPRDAIAMWIR